MAFFDLFRRNTKAEGVAAPRAEGITFTGMDDPLLLEYIRAGQSGACDAGLKNAAVLRCLTLISNGVGMLPLNLIRNDGDKAAAKDHPAYRLLKRRPNDWQTPREFKSLVMIRALMYGNGYARVIRAGGRPIRLVPITVDVKPKLTADYKIRYEVTSEGGAMETLDGQDVLHIRDLSTDGVSGISRMKMAAEAISVASQAQRAASRVFEKGVMAGGALEFPTVLSDKSYQRMRDSLANDYSGAENAGKWLLIEEGGKAVKWSATPADAQQVENRNHQIEEIARIFGVPRPLLMLDDTSWGSGIEQLAIFFVQYTLAPWFSAWEEALARVLLVDSEMDRLEFKFNERALLRGTLKDQSEFFVRALGAGGQSPWMTPNEVRELSDMPRSADDTADSLRNPMTERAKNEPAKAA